MTMSLAQKSKTHIVLLYIMNGSYVAKVLIQQLDVSVQELQRDELIVVLLQTTTEIQTRIPARHTRRHEKTRRTGQFSVYIYIVYIDIYIVSLNTFCVVCFLFFMSYNF